MANSCNKPQHRHNHNIDQQQHRHRHQHLLQQNATTKSRMKPFHKRSSLAVFVALVFLLSQDFQTTMASSSYMDISPSTIIDGNSSLQHKEDSNYDDKQHLGVSQNLTPEDSQTIDSVSSNNTDVDNDIFSGNDDKVESTTVDSTDLEQIIRNSVKNELEKEQGLELSPDLEILKDNGEAEISETLSQDLYEPELILNHDYATQNHSYNKFSDIEDRKPEIPSHAMLRDNVQEARNLEDQEVNENDEDSLSSPSSESNSSANSYESKNQHLAQSDETSKVEVQTGIQMKEDNPFLSKNVDGKNNQLEDKGEKVEEYSEENTQENQDKKTKSDILETHYRAAVNRIKSIEDIQEFTTISTADIIDLEDEGLIKGTDGNDEALSVVLDESLSSTVPSNEDETLKEAEETAQKTSLDIIAEEETTAMPDETEHVVIKKVLHENDIFVDEAETTVQPDFLPKVLIEVPHPTIIVEELPVTQEDTDNDGTHVISKDMTYTNSATTQDVKPTENDMETSTQKHDQTKENPETSLLITNDEYDEVETVTTKNLQDDLVEVETDNINNINIAEIQEPEQNEQVSSTQKYKETNEMDHTEAAIIMTSEKEVYVKTDISENHQDGVDLQKSQVLQHVKEEGDAEIQEPVQNEQVSSTQKYKETNEMDHPETAIIMTNKHEVYVESGISDNYQNGVDLEKSQVLQHVNEEGDEVVSENTFTSTEFNFATTNIQAETASLDFFNSTSTTEGGFLAADEIPVDGVNYVQPMKGSRSVNTALIDDDVAATMFETYPPQDAGQTFNGNLADESAVGIGKALPVSVNDGSNRSTTIIILSSGTAFIFIIISVTIFLISFQRQHGTLDIEMQERSCGKDNLDEEDAETFAKLLDVELPPSVAIALEETEECL
ncbi:dpp target gene [Musca autumnalis]|uniref:dpp target gene n=1 Tax=Musca autumnalis TaxID=221902 RepID=UPI003CEA7F82